MEFEDKSKIGPKELGAEKKDSEDTPEEKKFAIVKGGRYFGEIGRVIERKDGGNNIVLNSELNGKIIVPLGDIEFVDSEANAIEKSQKMLKEDRERNERAGI